MYISQTKLEVPLQHYPMFHIDLMSNIQHRVKGKGHFRRFKLLLGRIFRLNGKHGAGVPESEFRSRSLGVGAPECDVKKWKRRSTKYGKHGV